MEYKKVDKIKLQFHRKACPELALERSEGRSRRDAENAEKTCR